MFRNFFFIGSIGFLLGVLIRTLIPIPWIYIWIGIGVEIVLALFWFCIRRNPVLYACIGVICICLGIVRTNFVQIDIPNAFVPLLGHHASFEGVIVADPDIRETSDRLTVEVMYQNQKTKILAAVPLYPQFSVGEQVQLTGTLIKPKPFATDGGRSFAYDKFLAKDGIFAQMQRAQVKRIGPRTEFIYNVWGFFLDVKRICIKSIQNALPEPYVSLAVGIIAGGKQGLGPDLLAAFGTAGLLQIVVLSGYNVMIVAEGILKALAPLPKRMALSIAGFSIIAFVTAAGAGTSAIRAGIMAILALLSRATNYSYDVLMALCAALVLMVCINPLLLVYDPGLQLSFLATLGLILGVPILEIRMIWIHNAFVRELVTTTLAAQIAVLPLLLYQSGDLSLVAIPANMLTNPVVPFAMATSALAAFVGWICAPLATIAGLPAFALLWYIITVATYAARIPLAEVVIPAFSVWYMVAAYGGILGLVYIYKSKSE